MKNQICGTEMGPMSRNFTLGGSMAATRLIAIHINKGWTLVQYMADRIGYSKSIDKMDEGRIVSSYACNPWTYCEKFILS